MACVCLMGCKIPNVHLSLIFGLYPFFLSLSPSLSLSPFPSLSFSLFIPLYRSLSLSLSVSCILVHPATMCLCKVKCVDI